MKYNEYLFLASEITEIEAILKEIPEANVIERISFESRLEKARKALAELSHLKESHEK